MASSLAGRRFQSAGSQSGFTLLELIIVMLMAGLIMASMAQAYGNYMMSRDFYKTEQNAKNVLMAMDNFMLAYPGRVPCVARMDLPPTDPAFGVVTDCRDTSVAPGTCTLPDGTPAGYCVALRDVPVDTNGDSVPDTTKPMRIRIGTVPVQTLAVGLDDAVAGFSPYDHEFQIRISEMLDGYGSRMTYAVTEAQATESYIDGGGAIQIVDEFTPPRELAAKAEYVLVSHGRNRSGAIDMDGRPVGDDPDCIGVGLDVQNCDWRDPTKVDQWGTFVRALRGDVPGAGYFDDIVYNRVWMPFQLWEILERDNTAASYRYHSYNKNEGNVGAGVPEAKERLHIGGNALATDYTLLKDSTGAPIDSAEGNSQSKALCDETGNNCFDVGIIGGEEMANCPAGDAAWAVSYSRPKCAPVVSGSTGSPCPAGQYATGMEVDIATRAIRIICGS